MRARNQILVRALSACALLWTVNAGAIPITSSGVWTDLDPDTIANVSGIGTNRVTWGEPFGPIPPGGESAYVFDGVAPGDAPLDGSLFPFGDFTHENFTIFLPSITNANLQVELDFTGEGVQQTFSFDISHFETPNDGVPCGAGGAIPCPDLVTIPDASSVETVNLMGMTFLLEFIGFSEDGGNTITPGFLTMEAQENTATLYGRLVKVQQVPEPSTIALLGLAVLCLGLRGIRRRAWR